MAEGPFPEHYEPFETPLDANPMHPKNPKATRAALVKGATWRRSARPRTSYVATTYRLTEHFHYWTKQSLINAIMQPGTVRETGEELAKEKGIAAGDKVKVRSNRGFIRAVAVVTKRIKASRTAGIAPSPPSRSTTGFKGRRSRASLTNTLTPFVGDANTQTPEYKAFLEHREGLRRTEWHRNP